MMIGSLKPLAEISAEVGVPFVVDPARVCNDCAMQDNGGLVLGGCTSERSAVLLYLRAASRVLAGEGPRSETIPKAETIYTELKEKFVPPHVYVGPSAEDVARAEMWRQRMDDSLREAYGS